MARYIAFCAESAVKHQPILMLSRSFTPSKKIVAIRKFSPQRRG